MTCGTECGKIYRHLPDSEKQPRACKKCGLLGVAKGRVYHAKCVPARRSLIGVTCEDCGGRRRLCPIDGVVPVKCGRCQAKQVRLCEKCGLPGVTKGRKFHPDCSPRRGEAKVNVVCPGCRIERSIYPRDGWVPTRCMKCEAVRRKGEGNSNWKGGITPENKKIRASERYKQWRTEVFARDGFTCIWCGQVGGVLHADHIKPFATHPRLRFTLSNGRTLCVACHKKTPSYLCMGKKRKPTLKQMGLFIDVEMPNS